MRHPEIPSEILLGIVTTLMTDKHHSFAIKPRPTANDCGVVAERTVTMQLDEIREDPRNVVEHERSPYIPGDLHPLNGGEMLVHTSPRSSLSLRSSDTTSSSTFTARSPAECFSSSIFRSSSAMGFSKSIVVAPVAIRTS